MEIKVDKPADPNVDMIQCDQWLQLLDELNIGAFTVDLHRRISSMNLSAQALIGMRELEVVGNDCREVFTGVPCLVKCMFSDKADAEIEEPVVEIFDEEDTRHLVTRVATPVYGPDRNMIGCLTILQDHSPIADLINRVHHEERSLKIILDNLDVGIFTVNRGGLITFFNRAAEKISGYNRSQVLGEPFSAVFEGDSAPDVCLLKASIADGNSRSTQNGRMITIDGVTIPIRANYIALRNEKGTIVGGLATFHDLTLIRQLNQVISGRYTFYDMIGKSPTMQKIFEMVNVVSESNTTILIEGATGTGKDLLAKIIHSASRRSDKHMVKVNCAAIPDNLLESELFGYVKGAFTGADRDKPGRFQEADGGTIFLDEIGEIPLSLQAKLLRVLEDKEFYPLGGRRTVKVDVRIISATNRSLERLVEERLFREDLFYRLNVLRFELPSLKNRREDLPLLIPHIIRKLCVAKENGTPEISEEAMEVLLNYEYPGNVRELENILEHARIICRNEVIKPTHLPVSIQNRMAFHKPGVSLTQTITYGSNGGEREKIFRMLKQHNGHREKTARALGIDRTTLWRKMKRLGLTF